MSPVPVCTCPNKCAYHEEGLVQRQQGDRREEAVNHPSYYGGEDNPYEAIKVIEAWELGFNTGNTVKYISRAGKKNSDKEIEDLEKAAWYLNREIENLKKKRSQELHGS